LISEVVKALLVEPAMGSVCRLGLMHLFSTSARSKADIVTRVRLKSKEAGSVISSEKDFSSQPSQLSEGRIPEMFSSKMRLQKI